MRWLIVEDALRDRKGHWLEWVTTFERGFRELGDEVTVLADAEVEPDIRQALRADPVLPRSIWHRLGDGSGALTRYGRVFAHNWQTWRVMNRYLKRHPEFEAIFVPTVSVHHLVAWTRLIKGPLRKSKTRVLLFFVHGPLCKSLVGERISSDGSPSARLMIWLLKWIEPEVRAGKVMLGVETEAMKQGFEAVSGVPFVCFPQPVNLTAKTGEASRSTQTEIRMACYGAARAEKGSDVLQQAILLHRRRFPTSHTRFAVQWIEDFTFNGVSASKSPELLGDPQVEYLTNYFRNGEYANQLGKTNVMLLPYRFCSYGLRGSRVVIEAVINGIPVIATRGTTLATLAQNFGAGLTCEDGNPESLAASIREMELRFNELSEAAESRKAAAASYFSTVKFRELFLHPVGRLPAVVHADRLEAAECDRS